ncbi:MAG: glycosyltransferase family 4 protein [Pseudohaliea sp.]
MPRWPSGCDRVRILLVSQRYPPARRAGSELQVQLLARHLVAAGHELRVLTTVRGAAGSELPEESFLDPVTVPQCLPRQPAQWYCTRRHLAKHDWQPDIVHGHCLSPTCLAAAQHYLDRGTPFLLQPTLGGADGELARARLPGLRRWLDPLLRRIGAFAVLDRSIQADLQAIGIAEHRLRPVRNAFDSKQFYPVAPGQRAALRARLGLADTPTALFVGQLVPRKGVRELLAAWWQMAPGTGTAPQLVIVGEGPLAEELHSRARGTASIRFLGARDDVADLMRAADLLALPSFNESFGCATLEAMACGLPVITTATGLGVMLPIHERAGTVVPSGDVGALAAALYHLLQNAGVAQRMGREATSLAAPYRAPAVVSDTLALYQSLLS